MTVPRLVGMVHLDALPGAPGFGGDLAAVIASALDDAACLAEAGFGALMVENFGDAPFYPDRVPPETVAAMSRVVGEITSRFDLPVGVNVLRNDALAALAVAAVTGAEIIRVNVLSGIMYTDQGPIRGEAAEVARTRIRLCPEVRIFADVFVKHAVPPPGLGIDVAAHDLWQRGGADALIVSGSGTGAAVDPAQVRAVRDAVPDAPLLLGSGVTPDTVATLADMADGAIVGSWVKVDGDVSNPVDPTRASELVAAAREVGWV